MHHNGSAVKIIVVGNNSTMPDLLKTTLNSRRYILKNIPPKAIAGIQKTVPDVFVIDDINSEQAILKTCQHIRQYSCMPILVLATSRKPGMVEQMLDAGADDVLVKPVSGNILAAHINTLTRRARAEKDAALSIVNGNNGKKHHLIGLLSY